MSFLSCRRSFSYVVIFMITAAMLAGCGKIGTGEVKTAPPSSLSVFPKNQTLLPMTTGQNATSTSVPTPTPYVPGPLFDPGLDLRSGPVETTLEIEIPALEVTAHILGVGLTKENVMDAPKGPYGDPSWHAAFWYRGSSIPGAVGTATIAGHVNDLVGRAEIFMRLKRLKPGDLIIIHDKETLFEIEFTVDEVVLYSIKESSTPEVLERIYGIGPVTGLGPQPSLDGLAHLTLITCAGNYLDGQFDHHTVVFATRSN